MKAKKMLAKITFIIKIGHKVIRKLFQIVLKMAVKIMPCQINVLFTEQFCIHFYGD